MPDAAFSRILLKLSGESLMGDREYGIDPEKVGQHRARRSRASTTCGVEIAVVLGAGNIYRGIAGAAEGMDRATADYLGMLAIVINSVTLQDKLEAIGVHTRVQSAIAVAEVAEPYIRRRAMRHLEKGRVVIFAAGTGNPFFTSDTAAALRAQEIHADAILMAKNGVEGVYSADPRTDPGAEFIPEITHMEALQRGLRVMDSTAFSLCMDNHMPIHVFNMDDETNISRIVSGERVGTLVQHAMTIIDDFLADAKEHMAKSVDATRHKFATVRAGRASPSLLDRIVVDYYGTQTPLRQLATINAPEARLLTIQPYDKSAMKAIERSIQESDLGLTPEQRRLDHPPADPGDDRGAPQARWSRSRATWPRRDASRSATSAARSMHDLRELRESGEAGQDDEHRAEEALQKVTDAEIGAIDAALKAKEAEILEV